MPYQSQFTKEELSLLGLTGEPVKGILETPDEVRELKERLEAEFEEAFEPLREATAESQASAFSYRFC